MLPLRSAAASNFAAQADRGAYPLEAKLIVTDRSHGGLRDLCEAEQCQPGVCIGGHCSSRTPRYEIGRQSPPLSSYKYVGPGRGDFSLQDDDMTREQQWSIRSLLGRCALLFMVLLLAPLLWLLHQMLTLNSSAALYDCTDDYENWMHKWTSAKRSWCCEHRSRGCFVPRGRLHLPSGTPPDSADCSDASRSSEWPALYRDWCCARRQLGCQTVVVPPAASLPTNATSSTSSTGKTSTSTSTTERGYDCVNGFAHWEKVWKPSKSSWCCKHVSRGCSTTAAAHWPPTLDPTNYSCTVELLAVPGGWSANERVWCCEHKGRGCPTAPPSSTSSSTTSTISTVTMTATSTTLTATSTTSPTTTTPYNCRGNPFSAVKRWSDSQKVWCCEHEARGCPTPLPSTTVTTPGPTTTSTVPPYDCSGAPSDWTVQWSLQKKRWCCEYGVCPTTK